MVMESPATKALHVELPMNVSAAIVIDACLRLYAAFLRAVSPIAQAVGGPVPAPRLIATVLAPTATEFANTT